MAEYKSVTVDELFRSANGKAKYIQDYIDKSPGDYPVYSASLTGVFGFVDSYDFDGEYLTWVMNGYGGRVQEVRGRFSANRDRGVLVPLAGVEVPDLTYLRLALEPRLIDLAVGRVVEGRRNEYTKIYPGTAAEAVMTLPVKDDGQLDLELMQRVGHRLRCVEAAQAEVRKARDDLARATILIPCSEPYARISLSDHEVCELSIGTRVLRSQDAGSGIPVYSANVHVPFGHVSEPNILGFDRPSLIWGIDGIFDWNLIPADQPFATTDHCGRLQIKRSDLDEEYIYYALRASRSAYGFDRVFRASLRNVAASVEVVVPTNDAGQFSMERQKKLATTHRHIERTKLAALAALEDVLDARLAPDLYIDNVN